jgi:hypothetical protein
MNTEQLRRLARLGAVARLEQIRAEEAAIRVEFPELFGRGRRQDGAAAPAARGVRGRGSRKRSMSAAARKAASERMRRYWAERRKSKAAKGAAKAARAAK